MTTTTSAPTVLLLEGLRDRAIYIGGKAAATKEGPNFSISSMLADAGYRATEVPDEGREFAPDDLLFLRGSANWFPKLWRTLEHTPDDRRPLVVFWQTEPLPQPSSAGLPRPRLHAREIAKILLRDPNATDVYTNDRRLRRLHRRSLPHVLAVSSLDGADYLLERAITAAHVPLGYLPSHGRDLGLERDIDVLFLGALNVPRRRRLLRRLRARGIDVMAEGSWRDPAFWGENRTQLINRAKIFLNLQRYPGAFSGRRLILGMANKALVVSEPFTSPAPYVPGKHFVGAPFEELAAVIERYLADERARRQIVEAGHAFVTQELTMVRSVGRILELARDSRP